MAYIKSSTIEEHVIKVDYQPEAIRFYNYSYQAVEEALANAVFHKSYEIREPIKVNIRLDCIEILSHAGPVPPVGKDDLKKERVITIKYLNRRLGDLLRELHLTEGKGTGLPKIRRAMRNNGSDEAIFETDDDRSYFLTTLPVKYNKLLDGQVTDQATANDNSHLNNTDQASDQASDQAEKLLKYCSISHSTIEIMQHLGLSHRTYFRETLLLPLIKPGKLKRTIPDKPSSPKQRYIAVSPSDTDST